MGNTRKKVAVTVKRKRFQYDPENMKKAITAVKKNALGYRAAARKFGVPPSTLMKRVKEQHKNRGKSTVLLPEEEKEFCDWILRENDRGSPVRKEQLLDRVQAYLNTNKIKTKFTNNRPGRGWYERFINRYPEIADKFTNHKTLPGDRVNANLAEQSTRKSEAVCCGETCKSLHLTTPIAEFERLIQEAFGSDIVAQFKACNNAGLCWFGSTEHRSLYDVWRRYFSHFAQKTTNNVDRNTQGSTSSANNVTAKDEHIHLDDVSIELVNANGEAVSVMYEEVDTKSEIVDTFLSPPSDGSVSNASEFEGAMPSTPIVVVHRALNGCANPLILEKDESSTPEIVVQNVCTNSPILVKHEPSIPMVMVCRPQNERKQETSLSLFSSSEKTSPTVRKPRKLQKNHSPTSPMRTSQRRRTVGNYIMGKKRMAELEMELPRNLKLKREAKNIKMTQNMLHFQHP